MRTIAVVTGMFASTLVPLATAAAQVQATYFVAPPAAGGSDTNLGTIDQPFATIAHARDVVRTTNGAMTGDIVVYLRDGTYVQPATLVFAPVDSGTNGFTVIYAAYGSERPVISGARGIGPFSPAGSAGLWQASAPGLATRQLYVNGLRAERAGSSTSFLGIVKQDQFGYVATDTGI